MLDEHAAMRLRRWLRKKHKVESAAGRYLYGLRMGIVEPVFANLRCMLGLDRFTLRGARKVNTQWQLFTLVHNLGKIHRFAGEAPV